MRGAFSSRMMSRFRQAMMTVALAASATCSGCSLFGSTSAQKVPAGPPMGQPTTVMSYWDNKFCSVPDPHNGGEWAPCLLGRLLLLPGSGPPVCCDGSLVITAYDARPGPDGKLPFLEDWVVTTDNLKLCAIKDHIGWGYTLALPSDACKKYAGTIPELRMRVEFKPEKGSPLYAQPAPIRFASTDALWRESTYIPAVFGPDPIATTGTPPAPAAPNTLPPTSPQGPPVAPARYQPSAVPQFSTVSSSTQNVLRQPAAPPSLPAPAMAGQAPQQPNGMQPMPVQYPPQLQPLPRAQPAQGVPAAFNGIMQPTVPSGGQPMPSTYTPAMQQSMAPSGGQPMPGPTSMFTPAPGNNVQPASLQFQTGG